jgi:hypothetical protein
MLPPKGTGGLISENMNPLSCTSSFITIAFLRLPSTYESTV